MSSNRNSIAKLCNGYFPDIVLHRVNEFAAVAAPDSYKNDSTSRAAAIQVAKYNVLQRLRAALAHKDWKSVTACLPVILQEARSEPRVLFGAVVDSLSALCTASPLARLDEEEVAQQKARLLRLFRLIIQSDRLSLGRTESSVAARLNAVSADPSLSPLAGVHTDGDGGWAVLHMQQAMREGTGGQQGAGTGGPSKRSQSKQLHFASLLARIRHWSAGLVEELLAQGLYTEAIAVCEDSMRVDPPRPGRREGGRRGKRRKGVRLHVAEPEEEEAQGEVEGETEQQQEEVDELAGLLGTQAPPRASGGAKASPGNKKRKREQPSPEEEEEEKQGEGETGQESRQAQQLNLWHVRMLAMLGHAQLQLAEKGSYAFPGPSDGASLAQAQALRTGAEGHLRAVCEAVLHRLQGEARAPVIQRIVALGAGAVVTPTASEKAAAVAWAQRGALLTALRTWPYVSTAGDSLAHLLATTGEAEEAELLRQRWKAAMHAGRR